MLQDSIAVIHEPRKRVLGIMDQLNNLDHIFLWECRRIADNDTDFQDVLETLEAAWRAERKQARSSKNFLPLSIYSCSSRDVPRIYSGGRKPKQGTKPKRGRGRPPKGH